MIGNFRLPMQGNAAPASTEWTQAYYDDIYANSYTRPADWLTLPTVLSTDHKAVMLHAVYDHDSNFCALQCASNYTVDWGDGVVENFAANVSAYHNFTYSNHVGTDSTQGYRQSIVTITPQATFSLTKLDLNIKHNQALLGSYTTQWLDIRMAGSLISTLTINAVSIIARHRILEQFDFIGTNSLTNLSYAFNQCSALVKIVNLYTNGVNTMNNMFSGCSVLQCVPLMNTAAVLDATAVFIYCYSLRTIPLFNIANTVASSQMFSYCTSLEKIPLLNTIKVTDMSYMFNRCNALQTFPLLNTIAVTNMSYMFQSCYTLLTIPLLNTISVTTMLSMFNTCYALDSIPLLNTANVTTMNSMFSNCANLQSIPLLNTIKVTNMSNMFYSCSLLNTIPLLNTANVTTMNSMFIYCSVLESIPLINTIKVTDMSSAFSSCPALQTIPLLNMVAVNNMTSMLSSCSSLQAVPALDANLVVIAGRLNSVFGGSASLSKISMINFKITFSIGSLRLSAPAIVEVFNNLATVAGQSLTISGNWGTASLTAADRLIATNKGWTLIG